MHSTHRIPTVAIALAALLLAGSEARAQQQPAQLTIAIYAPSASFADSSARLAYVQGLARAVQTKTGIPTTGKAFVRFEDLRRAGPDFAIVDGLCIAARRPGTLLAVASIGGETLQRWALFATGGQSLQALKGKKLAYVRTGCRDNDFLENSMLESEVKLSYFGGLVDKPDVAGAVASVKDYRAAAAVFAPAGQGKGLGKLFDAGAVPTPGLVAMNKQLPQAVVDKVKEAVLGYGAGGGIDGWRTGSQAGYDGLAARMGTRVKRPVFAAPDPVRLESEDVLVAPKSESEQAVVRQHWETPARRRR